MFIPVPNLEIFYRSPGVPHFLSVQQRMFCNTKCSGKPGQVNLVREIAFFHRIRHWSIAVRGIALSLELEGWVEKVV